MWYIYNFSIPLGYISRSLIRKKDPVEENGFIDKYEWVTNSILTNQYHVPCCVGLYKKYKRPLEIRVFEANIRELLIKYQYKRGTCQKSIDFMS